MFLAGCGNAPKRADEQTAEDAYAEAAVIGTAAIVAIYLLINAAYLYLVPISEMPSSRLVARSRARRSSRKQKRWIPTKKASGAVCVKRVSMPIRRYA